MTDTTSQTGGMMPDLSHLTPIERFNDLENDVQNLSDRFDTFASNTGERFAQNSQQLSELSRSQGQTNELLVGLKTELRTRREGMELKDVFEAMGGVVKILFGAGAMFSIIAGGLVWLSTAIAFKGDARVSKEQSVVNNKQSIQLESLNKGIEILEEADSTIKSYVHDLGERFNDHISNGHPNATLAQVELIREDVKGLERDLRDVRESRNTAMDGHRRDDKITDLYSSVAELKALIEAKHPEKQ